MQEYGEVSKVLFHMEDVKQLLTEMGKAYLEREEMIKAVEMQYGKGASKILGEAMLRYGKA
ncbi:MAG TPA: hypothetical protein VHO68_02870 [Bacteroidales bacterium]|nr:hypothetical protein [Bacteroidales bacterium]